MVKNTSRILNVLDKTRFLFNLRPFENDAATPISPKLKQYPWLFSGVIAYTTIDCLPICVAIRSFSSFASSHPPDWTLVGSPCTFR